MVRKSSRLSWVSISFRPLTGMVLLKTRNYLDIKEFSPPYGDRTIRKIYEYDGAEFAPPYGDCTMKYIVILPEC